MKKFLFLLVTLCLARNYNGLMAQPSITITGVNITQTACYFTTILQGMTSVDTLGYGISTVNDTATALSNAIAVAQPNWVADTTEWEFCHPLDGNTMLIVFYVSDGVSIDTTHISFDWTNVSGLYINPNGYQLVFGNKKNEDIPGMEFVSNETIFADTLVFDFMSTIDADSGYFDSLTNIFIANENDFVVSNIATLPNGIVNFSSYFTTLKLGLTDSLYANQKYFLVFSTKDNTATNSIFSSFWYSLNCTNLYPTGLVYCPSWHPLVFSPETCFEEYEKASPSQKRLSIDIDTSWAYDEVSVYAYSKDSIVSVALFTGLDTTSMVFSESRFGSAPGSSTGVGDAPYAGFKSINLFAEAFKIINNRSEDTVFYKVIMTDVNGITFTSRMFSKVMRKYPDVPFMIDPQQCWDFVHNVQYNQIVQVCDTTWAPVDITFHGFGSFDSLNITMDGAVTGIGPDSIRVALNGDTLFLRRDTLNGISHYKRHIVVGIVVNDSVTIKVYVEYLPFTVLVKIGPEPQVRDTFGVPFSVQEIMPISCYYHSNFLVCQMSWQPCLAPFEIVNDSVLLNQNDDLWIWNVYPNPANSFINIKTEESGGINIFNPLGQLIFMRELEKGIFKFNMDNLSSGIYLVKFVTVDGRRYSRKIQKI